MTEKSITQEELKYYLTYNEETGVFTRNVKMGHYVANTPAGANHSSGYRTTSINGKQYLLHRLAFLYMEGYIPTQVDHNDQNRKNNKWSNLNASTNKNNSKNHTLRCTNNSGFTGVNWGKREKKWRARVMINGMEKYLGTFDNITDAVMARKQANIKYNFNANHGSQKFCHE